jgi:hypothetical protein
VRRYALRPLVSPCGGREGAYEARAPIEGRNITAASPRSAPTRAGLEPSNANERSRRCPTLRDASSQSNGLAVAAFARACGRRQTTAPPFEKKGRVIDAASITLPVFARLHPRNIAGGPGECLPDVIEEPFQPDKVPRGFGLGVVQLASPLLFDWLGSTGFEPKSNRKDVLVFRSMLGHQTASFPSQTRGKISRRSSRLPFVPMAKDHVPLMVACWTAGARLVCPWQNAAACIDRISPLHLGVLSMISRRNGPGVDGPPSCTDSSVEMAGIAALGCQSPRRSQEAAALPRSLT